MPVDVFNEDQYDPFNPEDIGAAQELLRKNANSEDELVVRYIERRSQAYGNVFSVGDTHQADIDFVMNDLAKFSYAFEPTFDENQKKQDLKEGRREVYLRIMEWAKLPATVLLRKYTEHKNG